MLRTVALILAGFVVLSCGSKEAVPRVVHVRDFGVVGDGRADDGPAIRRAVEAAIEAGPGATLVFEKRTYRLGMHGDGGGQISLTNVDGLTIEGNGSTLLLHPHNGIFDVRDCRNVVIRGFVIDFDPLPFTQGTILAVDAVAGSFDLEIHDGYPFPPPDALVKKLRGAGGWRWGSVIDPTARHRRWDVSDHFYIESVNALAGQPRTVRIKVTEPYAGRLAPVRAGDRFFLPLQLVGEGVRAFGSNILITRSAECTIENVTIHTARSGMVYTLIRNEGRITLRNNRIAFAPGSTRICTTWKDGVHCKDNRVGPLIENCYFEGMLDDSINIGANTAMAVEVISPTEFRLKGPDFGPGDKVMVFDPNGGSILAETRVATVRSEKGRRVIVLADPVEGVVTGRKRRHVDIKSTHFYNMSYASNRFVVRDCTFGPQRRHAILVRSSDGIIEGNVVDRVGGAAVSMGNEMGSFYEGPFPRNNIIRHNTIRNTQRPAIHIYTRSLGGSARHTRDIRVEGNTITVLPGSPGILIRAAANVLITGNRILDSSGADLGATGVKVTGSTGVRVE